MSDRHSWPCWVRLGMWGVPSAFAAWIYVWVSAGVAALCFVGGFFWDWRLLASFPLFLLAAVWYYGCIRWVQRSGQRLEPGPPGAG